MEKKQEAEIKETAPEVPVQEQPENNFKEIESEYSLERKIKELELSEVDKEEIKSEMLEKRYPEWTVEKRVNKYDYYRLMSDGKKMFYSKQYLESHTIEELKESFNKIS